MYNSIQITGTWTLKVSMQNDQTCYKASPALKYTHKNNWMIKHLMYYPFQDRNIFQLHHKTKTFSLLYDEYVTGFTYCFI